MKLIIVESPTKARTLSRFLGKDYIVEATQGHIKDLPKEKLSVDVEKKFEPNYVLVQKKKETVDKLIKASKKAGQIYLATDPDREGEAIASHVEEFLVDDASVSKGNIKRIVFHEITKSAVEEALGNPGIVNKNLVDAQIARRVLDRLVGYKLSPLLWKKVRRGLSAGRVQSVTVRLIVEREREIEAFKAEEYWEIFSDVQSLKTKSQNFLVKLLKLNDKPAKVENKDQADEIVGHLKVSEHRVFDVKRKEVGKVPYPPFTTSTLTQAASRLYSWSAKKTMSVAQKLYEEGLITYHRTDSTNLSQSAISEARTFIKTNYGENYLPENPRLYKTKSKLAQEAHEAIRPTDVKIQGHVSDSKFSDQEDKLYALIWKRFVACQMESVVFDQTAIDVIASPKNIPDKRYLLRASGQVIKFDGWRKVIPLTKEEEPSLPIVEKDEVLDLIKVISDQKFTQPPARYNEASLIKTLEKLGIGRPSTYAPIITTIQTRSYVEKNEGKFFPTSVGIAVNDFLVKNFPDIDDYPFTAEMENKLDEIAEGSQDWRLMMELFYMPFAEKLMSVEKDSERVKIEVEKTGEKCPTCKEGDEVIRVGRFGKFLSCSRFPECDYKKNYVEKIDMKCLKCKKGDVIVRFTKTRRRFYGCSRYPKCKWASWKKPVKPGEKPEESN